MNQNLTEPNEEIIDAPITEFNCHLANRDNARKAVTKLSKSHDDKETASAIRALPLKTRAGIPKNMLAAKSEGVDIFWINIKTGRMFHR